MKLLGHRRQKHERVRFIGYRDWMPFGSRYQWLFQGGLAMNEEYYDLQALAYEEEWREEKIERMFENGSTESE